MRKIALALLILIMAASLAAADTVYLRDGRTIRGTVLGYISGRFAIRVDQQTQITTGNNTNQTVQAGEIAYLRPRDIERVEIEGRNLDEARYLTRNVEVALGPNWVDTGIDVRRGQRIQITSTGTIYAGRSRITPAGLRSTDPNAPLPRAAEGVLIATIGTDPNAPITEIGANREFQADRDGRLYLTVNRGDYTDARGSFNAQVRRELDFGGRGAGRRSNADEEDFDPFGEASSSPAAVRRRTSGGGGGYGPGPSTPSASVMQEKSVVVPGNSRGTDTGIDLRTGDAVTITATGNITAGRRAGVVSADGGRVGVGSIVGTYPVAQAGVGALIGYIRTPNGQITQPFLVGSQQTFNSPVDGRLFLLINDDNYGDNSGQFDVRITYTPQGGAGFGGGAGDRVVTVPGDSEGTDTGIEVRRGDRVMINATGSVVANQRAGSVSPEGRSESYTLRQNYPVTDVGGGALIGYIQMRNGQRSRPFYIGSQNTFTAPVDGRLYLLINDNDYRDNSGSFSVRLSVQ
ncbi:MAG: hypothetical protein ICV60_08725 [Pyrinomonadaceae bacterium]|nr:hypothetical protein [Pyrinomonadaceae bacterium]